MTTEKNYIAHCAVWGETELFTTFDEAKQWLQDAWNSMVSDCEGWPDETISGQDYIAKISHRSFFNKTDEKKNYCQIECSDCTKETCDGEEWPYSNQFEFIGEVDLKAVEETLSSNWIKPSDKLPERMPKVHYSQVLCLVSRNGEVEVLAYNHQENCWDSEDCDDYVCDALAVDGWQPYPEAMQTGEEQKETPERMSGTECLESCIDEFLTEVKA